MPTRKLVTRYADDLALFPDRYHKLGLAVALGLAVVFPFISDAYWMSVAHTGLIAVVGATSMMILTGFCGQVSLGHAAFLALGAYTVAILGGVFGWPFWLALPVAGLVAAAVGLAVGPFALRLEGLYLAIVTVGLLFLVEHLLRNGLEIAFGKEYLTVPMHTLLGDADDPLGSFRADGLLDAGQKLYFLFVALAGGTLWISKNLQRSRTGRAMMAVRDRDLAAAVLGVDPARTKFLAFGLSSFLAGIAGGMYAFAHPVVTLEPFNLKMSVEYIAMVVLGGVGTTFGAAWGALAYTILLPVAETLGEHLPFPEGFSSEHQAIVLLFPALCLFLVFEPLGLLGIWLKLKRYFAAWPFRY
ncbi:MAG: branched-chain amino acid ABC transporter permease [Myxococcales bacterium]|nr:branched-chain amino acid ABC transporter permease [Myxococcales bacterium]